MMKTSSHDIPSHQASQWQFDGGLNTKRNSFAQFTPSDPIAPPGSKQILAFAPSLHHCTKIYWYTLCRVIFSIAPLGRN